MLHSSSTVKFIRMIGGGGEMGHAAKVHVALGRCLSRKTFIVYSLAKQVQFTCCTQVDIALYIYGVFLEFGTWVDLLIREFFKKQQTLRN